MDGKGTAVGLHGGVGYVGGISWEDNGSGVGLEGASEGNERDRFC